MADKTTKKRISIIIPAHNEANRISPTLVDYCSHFPDDGEIIVVLDHCEDNTEEIVANLAREYANIRLLKSENWYGKGAAIVEGLRVATGDLIAYTDADGATAAAELERLAGKLDSADGVVGSRWMKGSVVVRRQPWLRRLASRVFNLLVRLMFQMPYNDTQCGAKVFTRRAIEAVLDDLTITSFAFDVNLLYLLKRRGLKVLEVPTVWEDKYQSTLDLKKAAIIMFISIVRLRLKHVSPREFVKKHKAPLWITVFSLIAHWRWINFYSLGNGDFYAKYAAEMKEFLSMTTWGSSQMGFGGPNILIWRMPVNMVYGLFGAMGFNGGVADKILIFWPIMILAPLAGYYLTRKITGSELAALAGSFIFGYNTYFICLNTAGHEWLTVAFIYGAFAILAFIKTVETKHVGYGILTGILLAVVGAYDLRGVYLVVLVLLFYTMFRAALMLARRTLKELSVMCRYAALPILVYSGIAMYWIPFYVLSASFIQENVLGDGLFGSQFINIVPAITLHFPYWTGAMPSWFLLQPVPAYFWLIPGLAIAGLIAAKKDENVLFFGFIAMIGIFLTKQSGEPFTNMYLWLYEHFPGFSAFREATKFYYLVVIGYMILIGALIAWFEKRPKAVYRQAAPFIAILVIFIFAWNTRSMITGDIKTMFLPNERPAKYAALEKKILADPEFYRLIWLPEENEWKIRLNDHAIVSASQLALLGLLSPVNTNGNIAYDAIEVLQRPDANVVLDAQCVRYLVVPDVKKEDGEKIKADFGPSRAYIIREMSRLPFLKRVDMGRNGLVVFENTVYDPHVTARNSDFRSLRREFIEVRVNQLTGRRGIDFSEAFDKGWQIYALPHSKESWGKPAKVYPDMAIREFGKSSGNLAEELGFLFAKSPFASSHTGNDELTNRWIIDPVMIKKHLSKEYYHENSNGSIDVRLAIYYRPRLGFYAGVLISLHIFLICVFLLVKKFLKFDRDS